MIIDISNLNPSRRSEGQLDSADMSGQKVPVYAPIEWEKVNYSSICEPLPTVQAETKQLSDPPLPPPIQPFLTAKQPALNLTQRGQVFQHKANLICAITGIFFSKEKMTKPLFVFSKDGQ